MANLQDILKTQNLTQVEKEIANALLQDLKEAVKNLYTILRKIKKDNYKSIAVDKIPNKGFGKTINDRLLRASKF